MAFSSPAFTPSVITFPVDPIPAALARHREAWVEYAHFVVGLYTGADGCVDNPEGLLTQILGAMAAAIDAESVSPVQDAAEARAGGGAP